MPPEFHWWGVSVPPNLIDPTNTGSIRTSFPIATRRVTDRQINAPAERHVVRNVVLKPSNMSKDWDATSCRMSLGGVRPVRAIGRRCCWPNRISVNFESLKLDELSAQHTWMQWTIARNTSSLRVFLRSLTAVVNTQLLQSPLMVAYHALYTLCRRLSTCVLDDLSRSGSVVHVNDVQQNP